MIYRTSRGRPVKTRDPTYAKILLRLALELRSRCDRNCTSYLNFHVTDIYPARITLFTRSFYTLNYKWQFCWRRLDKWWGHTLRIRFFSNYYHEILRRWKRSDDAWTFDKNDAFDSVSNWLLQIATEIMLKKKKKMNNTNSELII